MAQIRKIRYLRGVGYVGVGFGPSFPTGGPMGPITAPPPAASASFTAVARGMSVPTAVKVVKSAPAPLVTSIDAAAGNSMDAPTTSDPGQTSSTAGQSSTTCPAGTIQDPSSGACVPVQQQAAPSAPPPMQPSWLVASGIAGAGALAWYFGFRKLALLAVGGATVYMLWPKLNPQMVSTASIVAAAV